MRDLIAAIYNMPGPIKAIWLIAITSIILNIILYKIIKKNGLPHTQQSIIPYGHKLTDCDGRSVEYCITFQEFQDRWLGPNRNIDRSHTFKSYCFLYDEGGVYGFPNCLVGFKTKDDQRKYKEWLQNNKETC